MAVMIYLLFNVFEEIVEHKALWQAVLGELEVSISRANFATWFKHTSILSNEDGHIIIAVPNIFNKEWLEQKYHDSIKSALAKLIGPIRSLEYKIVPPGSDKPSVDALKLKTLPESGQIGLTRSASNFNTRYTFDNFVVGSSNELAYATCRAVATNPGVKYNPLFIYGGTGLGKTHLIQAVGNEILANNPGKKVEYLTSEAFANEFISSIVRSKTGFTNKYRKVDVLIIDDMQFLGGKEKTQEEFFHTFNALHQANKQIIISSDKPPRAITTLEGRLRSRFESGMIADIQAPDYETRSAILQTKATSQGVLLDADVIELIAKNVQSNIRELEGVLTQLLAYCELRGIVPDVEIAKILIGGLSAKISKKPLSSTKLMEQIANYYSLSVADLTGPKRDKDIVAPRQVAMYFMRHELNLSFPKIAEVVGGRDHTTAMHSVAKIERLIEANEVLREDLNAIRDTLRSI